MPTACTTCRREHLAGGPTESSSTRLGHLPLGQVDLPKGATPDETLDRQIPPLHLPLSVEQARRVAAAALAGVAAAAVNRGAWGRRDRRRLAGAEGGRVRPPGLGGWVRGNVARNVREERVRVGAGDGHSQVPRAAAAGVARACSVAPRGGSEASRRDASAGHSCASDSCAADTHAAAGCASRRAAQLAGRGALPETVALGEEGIQNLCWGLAAAGRSLAFGAPALDVAASRQQRRAARSDGALLAQPALAGAEGKESQDGEHCGSLEGARRAAGTARSVSCRHHRAGQHACIPEQQCSKRSRQAHVRRQRPLQ